MDTRNKVDKKKAMNQWENLKKAIEGAGAKVHVMEPHVIFSFFLNFLNPISRERNIIPIWYFPLMPE